MTTSSMSLGAERYRESDPALYRVLTMPADALADAAAEAVYFFEQGHLEDDRVHWRQNFRAALDGTGRPLNEHCVGTYDHHYAVRRLAFLLGMIAGYAMFEMHWQTSNSKQQPPTAHVLYSDDCEVSVGGYEEVPVGWGPTPAWAYMRALVRLHLDDEARRVWCRDPNLAGSVATSTDLRLRQNAVLLEKK